MVHLLLAVIYLAFISLGLPDAMLGAAWPSMYPQLGADVSQAGIITVIIAAGTVVSSLMSDRLTRRLGAGRVTALSVGLTALALFGFSTCSAFWQLCLWAVPYGLGAGSVDAALNNYVALHYASRHMSWLHCMWGVGASVGPFVMSLALTGGQVWNAGYRYIAILQTVLSLILLASLPLWRDRRQDGAQADGGGGKALSLPQIAAIPGAKAVMAAFFCYSALEQSAGLWASSYLVLCRGVDAQTAAAFASLFYLGITAGRAASGFLTLKFSDPQMIRLGASVAAAGVTALLLPLGNVPALAGLVLVGLGCAPIYPCIIHSTPAHFGPERSQALIGVQMAVAYVGTCLAPPVYGLLASHVSPAVLPFYLLLFLAVMAVMHEVLLRRTAPAGR